MLLNDETTEYSKRALFIVESRIGDISAHFLKKRRNDFKLYWQ